jgi:ubiquinone/menaquinone biosynthesis C-methylase UbiE
MFKPSRVRQVAKRIAPLYWLVGVGRYLAFRARLAAENRAYLRPGTAGIPPPMLRYRVHGALDEASYSHVGRIAASHIVDALRRHGVDAAPTVLDFACGPGRIAAEIRTMLPSCRLYGTDTDLEAIGWATKNLAHIATFSANAASPPTRFEGASFDVVYAISLFTHLDEASQLAWLQELARVTKAGGIVLATVHGSVTRSSCTRSELKELSATGIAYRMDRRGRLKLDGLPDAYQTTFHAREYVERVWQRFFHVIEYVEGGLGDHQDLVVLRPRGTYSERAAS